MHSRRTDTFDSDLHVRISHSNADHGAGGPSRRPTLRRRKAMTRTLGDSDKTRLLASECDFLIFFSAFRKKTRFTLMEEFTIGYNF